MLLDIQKFYSVVVEELPTNVVDLLLTGFSLDCFLEKDIFILISSNSFQSWCCTAKLTTGSFQSSCKHLFPE
ncbi:hypothetical protein LguiB_013121 [Lonicera macranthoides]